MVVSLDFGVCRLPILLEKGDLISRGLSLAFLVVLVVVVVIPSVLAVSLAVVILKVAGS